MAFKERYFCMQYSAEANRAMLTSPLSKIYVSVAGVVESLVSQYLWSAAKDSMC